MNTDEDIARFDGESDSDDEGSRTGALTDYEILRSQSIGCVEQEAWKRLASSCSNHNLSKCIV